MDTRFLKHKAFMVAMFLLVVGGVNWGIKGVFGKDLVSYVAGKNAFAARVVFVLVGLAALSVAFYRDTYLPFLGPSVVPCSVLNVQTPENASVEVKVMANPGAKVLYWAAEPANEDLKTLNDWRKAYLQFRNAGVAVAAPNGLAVLKIRKPQAYTVPMRGKLMPHVHYRVCGAGGMLGRVETIDVNPATEAFADAVADQESFKQVPGPQEFVYVNPASSLELINTATLSTLQHSLMPQSGAMVEGPLPAGTPLNQAYAPDQIKVELL
jgi:uncharacterized membrane protein YuzA (DUF378 family)